MDKLKEHLEKLIENYNLEKLNKLLNLLKKWEYNFTTKKEYRTEILEIFNKTNEKDKKDILAKYYWMEKIWENKYIDYDSHMFISNFDLYYICEISTNGKVKIISPWFWTKKELKEYFANLK